MEDIKKAIEQEAEKAKDKYISKLRDICPKELNEQVARADYDQGFNNAVNFILSKWEESTRWRKVEEEKENIPYCVPLLLKLNDGDIKLGYYLDHKYREDSFYSINDNGIEFLIEGVTEWQPINK